MRLFGLVGILLIMALLFYGISDSLNLGPFFMGETHRLNGYILKKNLVPNGRNVIHRLDFKYSVQKKDYFDHYLSNKSISTLSIGDSIILEVSLSNPSKCKVVGYYKKKRN